MSVTLQDRVYFGAFWQILDREPASADIALGGGFRNASVQRSADGDFFSGVVEKVDASGRVTDVILTFAGAHGLDAVRGESILLGIPLDEAARATAAYDAILADPRYAGAKVHVTGHSLGAGYTEYVLAYAVTTYGEPATDARADFVAFGAPNWLGSAARHFGLDPAVLEGRFTDYTAANDPVLINGVERLGTTYYLPTLVDDDTLADLALSPVTSHEPTTYGSYLGLPSWLTEAQRTAAFEGVAAQSNNAQLGGSSWNPWYQPSTELGLFVDGSEAGDRLVGLAGADVIRGGGGRDVMTGGAGADLFRFDRALDTGATSQTADRITDFEAGVDRIDLSRVDANALTPLWNERFQLVDGPFTGAGQVRVFCAGGATWVAGNVDWDDAAEFLIRLDGRHALTGDDFLF